MNRVKTFKIFLLIIKRREKISQYDNVYFNPILKRVSLLIPFEKTLIIKYNKNVVLKQLLMNTLAIVLTILEYFTLIRTFNSV